MKVSAPEVASKALISATVPSNCTLLLLLPVTVTAGLVCISSLPLLTVNVTVMVVSLASTSVICKPVISWLVSSVPAEGVGSVLTGASLAPVKVMVA